MSEPTPDPLDLSWPDLIDTPHIQEDVDASDASPGDHLGDRDIDYGADGQ